ncbi:MAG: DUF3151 domain-containing protein [Ornithinimicrobium sp.]|uniref:DUF3151 domain-containing protein n=1 Tax=Ornithinimicrobium sp. TaxID=1977084 RepID=UPI003D9BEC26
MSDDLLGIPATHLPVDPAADLLEQGIDPRQVAAAHPSSSLAWAVLAQDALEDGLDLEGYAFARSGYHRGLDALRQAGWRGQGPVPWSHEPNRGFLRSLASLAVAAQRIGEDEEQRRCADFLRASSAQAARELGL